MQDLSPLLPELERIARRAGEMAVAAKSDQVRELKPDGSIVTPADRDVEAYIRPELTRIVEGSTVWGEELGHSEEGSGGLWVVDPIDGTSNYAFGSPLWGVSIGLIRGEEILLGAIYLPDLDEMYLAAKGWGVRCNGVEMGRIPRGIVQPEELLGCCFSVTRQFPSQRWPGKLRCNGAFVVEAAFVLQQRLRGLVGIQEKLYDVAPSILMALELGAEVRYADGLPLKIGELKRDLKISRPWLIFPADSHFKLDGS